MNHHTELTDLEEGKIRIEFEGRGVTYELSKEKQKAFHYE